MHDRHNETGRGHEPSTTGTMTRGLGCLCVIIGILMGIWLFFKIYAFVDDPSLFAQFQQLVTESLEAAINSSDGDAKVIIPLEPISYLLLFLLLGILIRIAGLFLSSGTKLLGREPQPTPKEPSEPATEIADKNNHCG